MPGLALVSSIFLANFEARLDNPSTSGDVATGFANGASVIVFFDSETRLDVLRGSTNFLVVLICGNDSLDSDVLLTSEVSTGIYSL